MPGSGARLHGLGDVVASSSAAASALAQGVSDLPFDSVPFDSLPLDQDASYEVKIARATPRLAPSLTTAADLLNRCAGRCRYAADMIFTDLKTHPEHRPPLPQLTDAQYAALGQIALGGATRFTPAEGPASVTGNDGRTIHPKPFSVLEQASLVRVARIPVYGGQDVVVTVAGELALDLQARQTRAATPAKAPAPPDITGRHR